MADQRSSVQSREPRAFEILFVTCKSIHHDAGQLGDAPSAAVLGACSWSRAAAAEGVCSLAGSFWSSLLCAWEFGVVIEPALMSGGIDLGNDVVATMLPKQLCSGM